jgi:hypothetical protein
LLSILELLKISDDVFVVFIVKVRKIKGTTLIDSTALDALLFAREWNPGKSAQFMCATDRGNTIGVLPGKMHNGSPQKTPAGNKLSIKERLAAREPTPFYQKPVNVDLIAEEDEEEEEKVASDGTVIKVEEPESKDKDYNNTEHGAVSAATVTSSDTVEESRSPEVVQPPVQKRQKRG